MLARFATPSLVAVVAACVTSGEKERSPDVPPASADNVPRSPLALDAWLQQRPYASWRRETTPHESRGPHGASVRAYLNGALVASLAAGDVEHPAGSAAVKELLTNGRVSGWLVMVKSRATSDSGDGWYWYEVTSAYAAATAGNGIPACVECHRRGRDFVRITYPLR